MADKKLKHVLGMKSNSQSRTVEEKEEILKNLSEKLHFFQRKAMNTRMMRDSFKYLDAIIKIWEAFGGVKVMSKVSFRRNNPKIWLTIESGVFKWVLMMVYHQQEYQEEGNAKNWSHVFYEYLQCEDSLRYNVLEASQVKTYYDILSVCMDHLTPEIHDAAEELIRFFDNHRIDPYSALIGQTPSTEILKFSLNISDDTLDQSLNYDVTTGEIVRRPDFKNMYSGLISSLVYWSTLPESDTLVNLRKIASSIRGIQNIEIGSLVLVRVTKSTIVYFLGENAEPQDIWVFARVAGLITKATKLLVYLDPTEATITSVSFDKVIPVAPEMLKKYIDGKIPSELGQAVTHLSSVLSFKITSFCQSKLKEYLMDMGIPKEGMDLIIKNQSRIEHQNIVKKLCEILEKPLPESLLSEMREYTDKMKAIFNQNYDSAPKWCFFVPSMSKDKEAMESFDFMKGVNSELAEYRDSCKVCLDDINSQKHDVFKGIRKKNLVSGWLRRIKENVDLFLGQNGYEFDIIPSNYLDKPPKSIAAVRRNLVLLRRILKSYYSTDKDPFKLKKLVKEICDVTYSLIDQFIEDIYYCVAEVLEITPEKCKSYTLEELNTVIQGKNLDEKVCMKTVGVMKDRFHLYDMKRMENDEAFGETQKMKIVPISGLIISKLARLENECKSVLDLWEPVRIPKTAEDARTPLESAVIKCDIKQLDHLLKGNLAYINEQDNNGWTALHLSCSFCFNEHRLHITEYLLTTYEEADVTVTNNLGNTCVHYLARMPITEEIRPKYRDVLHLILRNGNAIYCENIRGETPLHLSSLAANACATRYLLECGADPNTPSKDGSTPLHYAVQSTNEECVEILLSYSADYRMQNNNGETCIDIAVKLNLITIVTLLQEQSWTEQRAEEAERKKTRRIECKTSSLKSWNSVTELPSIALIRSPSDKKIAVPKPPPRKPKISDPVTGNWTKAPIPDDLKDAMLKLMNEEAEKSTPPSSVPPVPGKPEGLASIISKQAKERAEEREKRVSTKQSTEETNEKLNQAKEILKGKKFCRVVWDIEAEDEDELDLKIGDLVEVVQEDESGWWTGSFRGLIGTFPVNYTEIIDDISKLPPEPKPRTESILEMDLPNLEPTRTQVEKVVRPMSMINIPSDHKTPITFDTKKLARPPQRARPPILDRQTSLPTIPDNIPTPQEEVKEENNENPSNQPDPLLSRELPSVPRRGGLPSPPVGNRPRRIKAVVIETFEGETDEEISLEKNAIVFVIQKDDDGWWTVETADQRRGIFPGSHLREQIPRGPGRGRVRGGRRVLKP